MTTGYIEFVYEDKAYQDVQVMEEEGGGAGGGGGGSAGANDVLDSD